MKDLKEHWRWMTKQANQMTKRSLVGDKELKEEIELLEDELLTMRKKCDKLQQELNDVKSNKHVPSDYELRCRGYEYIHSPIQPISFHQPGDQPAESSSLFRVGWDTNRGR